ncbi:MAG: hypothetical protein ACM3OB_02155 [Acidobacteriota bacterium]
MAVYEHGHRPYAGPLRPARWRFLVLTRFGFAEALRSRLLLLLFGVGCLAPLVWATVVYLRYNVTALQALAIDPRKLAPIDASFFYWFLNVQSGIGFVLTAFVGPQLVAPDLAHGAIALYLARPFSRREYVLGKLCVLLTLLSALTWVPGLLLFFFQAGLAEPGWLLANLRVGGAIFVASLVWMLVLALLALAISAWVKWRSLAGMMFFGFFVLGAAFGTVVSGTFGTGWGHVFNLGLLLREVWAALFGIEPLGLPGRLPSLGAAWLALLAIAASSLVLLARRVRALEVVR